MGDIVYEAAAVSTAIESVSERLEFLLSRSIPNLECHDVVIDDNLLLTEVSTDCRLRIGVDFAIEILLEQGCLSDA